MNSEFSMPRPTPPSSWPTEIREEFERNIGNGRVGSRLVSQSDRVRIWHLNLQPGERISFHTHVLDYFWTVHTSGKGRSNYMNGDVADVSYSIGDTKHMKFEAGEFMIHDLQNIGDSELVFTTVEFIQSANSPLVLD